MAKHIGYLRKMTFQKGDKIMEASNTKAKTMKVMGQGSHRAQENPPVHPAGTIMRKGKPLPMFDESDGSPLRCGYCGNEAFDWTTTSSIDSIQCEADIHCGGCGLLATRWAYGIFEPVTHKNQL